jgi:hypothetical protein
VIGELDARVTKEQWDVRQKAMQVATAETTLSGVSMRLTSVRAELAAVITRNQANSTYSSSIGNETGGYSSSQSQQVNSQYGSSGGGDGRGNYSPISGEENSLCQQIANLEGEVRNLERIIRDACAAERECQQEHARLIAARDEQIRQKNSTLQEIKDDERKIDNCNRAIGYQNWAMNMPNLQNLVRQAEEQRAPHLREQARLKAEIDSNELESSQLKSRWRANVTLLSQSQRLQGKYSVNTSVAELERMRDAQQKVLDALKREESQKRNDILDQEAVINAKETQRSSFEKLLSDHQGRKFLFDLRDRPQELLEYTHGKLIRIILQYEKSHQSGQSVAVRACLAKLRDKADFILANNDVAGADELEIAGFKYYQLSGLIHHEIGRLDNAELVTSLNDAFANELVDAREAEHEYLQLQGVWLAALRDLTADDVRNEDLRKYTEARDAFQQALDQLPVKASRQWRNLKYYCSRALKDSERHRVAAVKAGDDSFDYKFHTSLINSLASVYATPKDQLVRGELHDLSTHIPYGNPSYRKKLGGIIMMVLGAAAAIAGLAVGFASLGLLSPVSLGLMAGGACLFTAGAAMRISGRQKDEAKSVANVERAASDPKLTSSLFPRAELLHEPDVGNRNPDASAPSAFDVGIKL